MEFTMPPAGEVHLWWASLDVNDPTLDRLLSLLSPAEKERAGRLRIENARRRFIASRAALRIVLGGVVGEDPAGVEFVYGLRGKPSLNGGPHFNASDSGDTVVVGLATHELGVDVEVARPLDNPQRLAKRICSPFELDQLQAIPEADLNIALLRLWTVKEAGLKAVGTGLSGGLQNVEAEIGADGSIRLHRLREHRGDWELQTTILAESLHCSVVVGGSGSRLVSREFELQIS